MANIQVIQGADKGRRFDLIRGENTIGRLSRSVPLTDPTVSRQHARLLPSNGRWILEDSGSANGTYLNGVKVSRPTPLVRGDQIRCGSTLLIFGGTDLETGHIRASVEVDEDGQLVDAAIVATVPSNEDSVVIPTPEAGKEAIGSLRVLYDLSSELATLLNIDQLLNRTLDKVMDILSADRGYVMLVDDTGQLELRASRISPQCPSKKIPISNTIVKEVMTKQVGVLSSNAMSDRRFASGKSVHDLGIRSAICVPIKGREKTLGVIAVDAGVREQTYSTLQLRLLTAIGCQLGLAIDNVRLYQANIQSERLAAVGETVAFLSHHTKNILQALTAGADVVEMGLSAGKLDKARSAWPIVQRNLGRINDLILNMLTFSKNRQPLLENINVNHVLQECLDLLTPQADQRQVAILSSLDDVPPIPADSGGLHQAFLNLLNNALDAVIDKSGAITISSNFDRLTRCVVITISDNGRGIEESKLKQIFTPFYSDKGQRGTGLGLAVAQKVVREHHGRLEVSSTFGEGTTFTLTLPSADSTNAGDTTSAGQVVS